MSVFSLFNHICHSKVDRTPTVLTRIYGKAALADHNYSNTLTSVGFAGTVVGVRFISITLMTYSHDISVQMLVFGVLSDKIGRKFGMVST